MHTRFLAFMRNTAIVAAITMAFAGTSYAQNEPDMQLVSKDSPITAVVGEEDGEGLWIVSSDGTSYSVWTPEEISLEDISAFQSYYKNKEVTLTGDVYKDKYGNLNLFVKSLPQ